MKDQLKKRVKLLGMPDSGDSAYARLYLDVYLDNKSRRLVPQIQMEKLFQQFRLQLICGYLLNTGITMTVGKI